MAVQTRGGASPQDRPGFAPQERSQVHATPRSEPSARAVSWWAPGWPLGLARIITGWLWASQLSWKMPPLFGCGPDLRVGLDGGLCDWVGREIAYPLIPAYADFLNAVVVPHFALFGWAVWFAEAFVAVSLLFGVFTRLGGLVGTLQAAQLTIGLWAVPAEWYWAYVMLTVLNAQAMFTGAGRFLGLDRWILPRLEALAARGGIFRYLPWLA
jgi:thiosulfate dehydrogenase (quinone) large subunit